MEIKYADKSMMKILEDDRIIRKKRGDIAEKLIRRMSDLRVADNLSQITHLPSPRRHKLTGNWEGCWGIDVSKNQRLIVRPIGNFDPDDLTTITTIRIESIEDYH
ncbi:MULTISPECIES: type II toxin-antitoxin system RelE/ParE family toxin [Gordonibacter]|uniref:Type II toxin-antitoxin system RelE/ParE family toxin n=1 Tax=Gordonibacter faecis TaxID=3047475 RepID=A0ABT7DLG0_9ACTN|nr:MULTISPECIES: type II toxin-antitoxin system RelE/ParE family toxin [unclassified Gordonibacter]MDJ1650242.1 type II toxin-antitoxin system RelE/ParE family toxin [Gordonibacter sp. KGMB12511]HIW75927.1 type II toxin-antitoxin system RelE/ParE family toxin [Candidatus Gordonibacter avicola]